MSEVREGYKMTELGEIPSEWEVKTTGELFENVSKKGFETLPVLSVTQDNGVVYRDDLDINIKYDKKSLKTYKLIESGQFVISLRSFQGGIEYSKITGISSPAYTILQPLEGVDTDYFRHLFKSFWFIDKLKGSIVGIRDGKQISYNDFKVIKLLLPTLKEQQKIASILSTVDEQIYETEQLIVKTKELKKGLMQQLLTKGIGHTEFKQTELGEIPADWQVKSIKEVFALISGYAFKSKLFKSEPEQETLQVIKMGNVKQGKLDLTKNKAFISINDILEPQNKYKLQNEDIVISLTGTVGKRDYGNVAFIERDNVLVVNQRVGCLRKDKEKIDSRYYFYFLQTELFRMSFFEIGVGGTGNQSNVSLVDVGEVKIPFPNLKEQQKIAQILSTVDEQIEVYEEEKVKYEELKKGLMQQLLTGQIRVKI
ncbi:restriction endonuclease subunit S [Lysinibacillus sp. NPDC098008]|uniref:restriction endonuclease subunit S n=1 Tax=Lysinibacillus sp. NPDC098008 TaxID=3364146 RepID=UPI0037F53B08